MTIVAIVTIDILAVAEPRHGGLGWAVVSDRGAVAEPRHWGVGWAVVTDRGAVAEPRHGGLGYGGASAWGNRDGACGWGWRGIEVLANLYRSELLLNRGA